MRQLTANAAAIETPNGKPVASSSPAPPCQEAVQTSSAPGSAATNGQALDASAPATNVFDGIQDDVDFSSKYVSIFLDEAELTLDQLTESLLAGADENVTEKVLVLCHRMKGSAATVGLSKAAKLAHYMEDLLQALQENGSQLAVSMTDAMLDCTEALRVYVSGLKEGASRTEQFVDVYRKLIQSQAGKPTAPGSKSSVPSSAAVPTVEVAAPPNADWPELTAEACTRVAAAAPMGQPYCVGQVVFRQEHPQVALKARLLYEKLSRAGEVFHCEPPEAEIDNVENLRAMVFGMATDVSAESLRPKLTVDGVLRVELRGFNGASAADAITNSNEASVSQKSSESNSARPASAAAEETAAKEPATKNLAEKAAADKSTADKGEGNSKPTETVRVDIERLDQLMNLAGQLVINRASIRSNRHRPATDPDR